MRPHVTISLASRVWLMPGRSPSPVAVSPLTSRSHRSARRSSPASLRLCSISNPPSVRVTPPASRAAALRFGRHCRDRVCSNKQGSVPAPVPLEHVPEPYLSFLLPRSARTRYTANGKRTGSLPSSLRRSDGLCRKRERPNIILIIVRFRSSLLDFCVVNQKRKTAADLENRAPS